MLFFLSIHNFFYDNSSVYYVIDYYMYIINNAVCIIVLNLLIIHCIGFKFCTQC